LIGRVKQLGEKTELSTIERDGTPISGGFSPHWAMQECTSSCRSTRLNRLCCKKLKENKMSRECLCLFSLSNHSKQLGNECNLTSHVSLCHALQLPLPYHVHDLKTL
jgi:hypothetical protein